MHELPLAGALAVAQRLDDGGGRDDPVAGVAVGRHLPDRRRAVVRAARLVRRAGQGVAHLVVARQRRARPVALEAAGVAVDDRRVDRPRLLVADAEALGDAGAHVVVDDVRPLDQAAGDLLALRVLEVEGERLLAVARADVDGVGEVEVARRDLEHRGAEVGQDLRTERPGDGETEVEHEHAGQRRVRGRCRRGAARSRHPLGGDVGDVGRRCRPGPDRRRFDAVERVDVADLADRAVLGIVELDDHALGGQRLVEQRLLGRQDRLQADPRRGAEAHPLVAGPGGHRGGRLDERLGLGPHAASRSHRRRWPPAAPPPGRRRLRWPAGRCARTAPTGAATRRHRPGRCPSAPAGRSTTGGSSGASWRPAATPSRSC